MVLSTQEKKRLKRIIAIAEKLIADSPQPKMGRPPLRLKSATPKAKRVRRSGKELADFRKMLKRERRRGVPVAELARKHKVSATYIYLLP